MKFWPSGPRESGAGLFTSHHILNKRGIPGPDRVYYLLFRRAAAVRTLVNPDVKTQTEAYFLLAIVSTTGQWSETPAA